MDIGEKVAFLRKQKGWSQGQLAKASGLKQGQISQIETGKKKSPTAATLRKICDALGVSMAEFDDSRDNLTRVLEVADSMNLQGEYKEALEKLKAMPIEEQQARLDKAIEEFKSLPPETRMALQIIIASLASTQR